MVKFLKVRILDCFTQRSSEQTALLEILHLQRVAQVEMIIQHECEGGVDASWKTT